ncbi:P-loop containing nucleoside triphosphate hydrolase protein [Daedaleopsis nitida]|nr:P-loop containing nucleoside triphosphate hydrolase protein [Daedaleopsis nitida]
MLVTLLVGLCRSWTSPAHCVLPDCLMASYRDVRGFPDGIDYRAQIRGLLRQGLVRDTMFMFMISIYIVDKSGGSRMPSFRLDMLLLPGPSNKHALSTLPLCCEPPGPCPNVLKPHSRRLPVPLRPALQHYYTSKPPSTMSSRSKIRIIHQHLIDDTFPPIEVSDEVSEPTLTAAVFDDFFQDCPAPRFVGLAPIYTERGALCRLALAVRTKVMIVMFPAKGKGTKAYAGRDFLRSHVLCNPAVTLLSFDFDKLAIALFTDQDLRVVNGVDIQSACGSGRDPFATIKHVVGEQVPVNQKNVNSVFQSSILDQKDQKRTTHFALQAWAAQCLPTFEGMEEIFRSAKMINTQDIPELELLTAAQFQRGEQNLQLMQSTTLAHEYRAVGHNDQNAMLRAERFQTRFMQSDRQQRIGVRDTATGNEFFVNGRVTSVVGRNTVIDTGINLANRTIISVTTLGPDGPTNADRARREAVLQMLQGRVDLFENAFLKYIFNPSPDFSWPETFPTADTIPAVVSKRPLNDSQLKSVEHMLAHTDDKRLSIIQGPPGTGKTTVIAAYVCSAIAARETGIWLVAQSNIAVKNIAEKLADVGFTDFRLLVSNDFHVGWHEHLYGRITRNIITSREIPRSRHRIQGISVILCTLSMLAHARLNIITSANPIKTLVVDEASQITLGQYVSPLQTFTTITKICMIGDDKQLPPYGADDNGNIKSIFEIEHLRPSILFLSIQYRMPPLIGEVVSDVVYNGQLQSNPTHPVPLHQPCC